MSKTIFLRLLLTATAVLLIGQCQRNLNFRFANVIDTQRNRVQSGLYNYTGEIVHTDTRNPLK